MSHKLRVMLVVPDLQDLGVQHDVRCLMKYWNREKYLPVMLLHKREGAFADQFSREVEALEVDRFIPDVKKARVLFRVVGYARAFRAFKPDAVISFVPVTNLTSAWARPLSRRRFGLAVSEHAHVTASMKDGEAFNGAFLWYYRRTFPSIYNQRADLVKCIAEESRHDLIENHGIIGSRTRLIYNPVDMDEIVHVSREPVEHPWFDEKERARVPVVLNVGRLSSQKRQDLMLDAFAIVRRTRRARLAFVGRGPHLERLQARARSLGIEQDVVFLGFQRNPWKFMSKASMLAMSSQWEGLPCVLTEAMLLGLPIVSTRCPSGPTEMLLDGRGGLLVPMDDRHSLAAAVEQVLDDPTGARARADEASAHLDRFRPSNVTRQYEVLAEELADLATAD